ncbi:hypothetical protein [Roseomonas sp. WA12]
MTRRHLLLAGCIALPVAFAAGLGAHAQAEAERQLDAAIARLRSGLGPEGAVEWQSRSVDPVSGTARLAGVTVRRGAERMTAEEVVLGGLAGDRVGRAVLSGLRMEGVTTEKPGRILATVGRVTFAGLVLPAVPGAAPGAASVDWSAASAEEALAEGMRMENPGRGDAELGRLSLAGYAPGRLREAVVEGFRFTDRNDGEVRIRLGRARLAGAEVPRIGGAIDPWALAADAVELEGVELAVEKQQVTLRLGRAQAEGWGPGRLATIGIEGVGVQGETPETGPFTAELGRMSVKGVAVRDMAHAFTHDVNPPQLGPGQEQQAEVEGFGVSTNGAPLLQVGRMRARAGWDPATPGIELGSVGVEGLALDLPAEYGGSWLDGLGIKRVLGALELGTRTNRAERRLVTDPLSLRADGLARLGFTADLRGFEVPAPGQPVADDPMAMMASCSMAGFTMRYTDDGLLRAIVAQQAQQQGVPERQLREGYASMVMQMPIPGAGAGKGGAELGRLRSALASFARDLGTIDVSLRPAKPVPLMEMMAVSSMPPDELVRRMNITATATPPGR